MRSGRPFAINLDAAAIEQATASGRIADVPERTHAIREAVGHMQRHVRVMLYQLRPANPVEIWLTPALCALIAFWRARRPQTDITLAAMELFRRDIHAIRFDNGTATCGSLI
jgi:hypothetical protein